MTCSRDLAAVPLVLTILLFLAVLITPGSAQTARQFQAVYGGAGNDDGDGGLLMLDDGGLMMVGSTSSYGNDVDLYVAKTDACGRLIWARSYDLGGRDYGRKIRYAHPYGFTVIGATEDDRGDRDAFLLTLEPDGEVRWFRTFGYRDCSGEMATREEGLNMRVDVTGEIYAVGYVSDGPAGGEDAWIWKVNPDGTLAWSYTYGGGGDDRFNGIDWTLDRDMVVAGSTRSYTTDGNKQILSMRFSPEDGSMKWALERGGPLDDEARSAAVSNRTTNFYIVGTSGNHAYAERITFVTGTTLAERVIHSSNPELDMEINEVVMTQYLPYTAGGVMREDGTWDMHMLRFVEETMQPDISRSYGGAGNDKGYATIRVYDHRGTVDSAAFLGTTTSFGRGGSDMYLVGTLNNGVAGCHEAVQPVVTVQPGFTSNAITLDRRPYLTTGPFVAGTPRNDYSILCNTCGTLGLPGGSRDDGDLGTQPDLTRRSTTPDEQRVVVRTVRRASPAAGSR